MMNPKNSGIGIVAAAIAYGTVRLQSYFTVGASPGVGSKGVLAGPRAKDITSLGFGSAGEAYNWFMAVRASYLYSNARTLVRLVRGGAFSRTISSITISVVAGVWLKYFVTPGTFSRVRDRMFSGSSHKWIVPYLSGRIVTDEIHQVARKCGFESRKGLTA